jgi:hypothetical protein
MSSIGWVGVPKRAVLSASCIHTGWRVHRRPFHPEQLSLHAMMGWFGLLEWLKRHWVKVQRSGFHQYVQKLQILSLGRTAWVHMVLKVVAISMKTVPVYVELMWVLWEWGYVPVSCGDFRETDPQSSIPAGVS